MPQTAQFTTLQRASAHDDVNSPETDATTEDVVWDPGQTRGAWCCATEQMLRPPVFATAQADATRLRPFTGTEQNETRPDRVVNLPGRRTTPKLTPSLHALQEWEGYVTEINDSDFVANLLDITAGDTYAGEEVVIPLEEISEADVARMHTGSIFRWGNRLRARPVGKQEACLSNRVPQPAGFHQERFAGGRGLGRKDDGGL